MVNTNFMFALLLLAPPCRQIQFLLPLFKLNSWLIHQLSKLQKKRRRDFKLLNWKLISHQKVSEKDFKHLFWVWVCVNQHILYHFFDQIDKFGLSTSQFDRKKERKKMNTLNSFDFLLGFPMCTILQGLVFVNVVETKESGGEYNRNKSEKFGGGNVVVVGKREQRRRYS